MSIAIIEHRVILYPSKLNDIDNSIQEYINVIKSTCSQEYGYILDVGQISTNHNNIRIIHETGNCELTMTLEIKFLKPLIGKSYSAEITAIYPSIGIMTKIHSMRVMIPSTYIGKHTQYTIGQTETVKILDIQYAQGEYQCIGKFEDEYELFY